MRSFLRGSLYGGVSATQSWINPQAQPQQQQGGAGASSSSPSATTSSFPQAHQQQRGVSASSMMTKTQYDNAASFYRYQQQGPSSSYATPNSNKIQQQSFNNNNSASRTSTTATERIPVTPTNTPVEFENNNLEFPSASMNASAILPESEYINGKFIMRGRVSKWFDQRGFGFIQNGEDLEQQFFVHARDLVTANGGLKTLYLGQAVEFEPEQTENGGHAMNVCAVGGAPLENMNTITTPPPASSFASTPVAAPNTNIQRPLPTYTTAVQAVVSQQAPPTIISAASESELVSSEQEQNEEDEPALPQPRFFGIVAHWTVDKGYGFIEVAGQEEHFFTHIKDFTCAKTTQSPAMPQAGFEVEFTPSYAGNRKRATHVTLPNSVPFEPNVVAQHQQHLKKKAQLSSLAKAFALPEKKTVSSFQ